MQLAAETFQTARMTGETEFGFTFKAVDVSGNVSEDTEFDLVLGSIAANTAPAVAVQHYRERIAQFQWVADAIVQAAANKEG